MASNADVLSVASFEDIGATAEEIPHRNGPHLGRPDPDEAGSLSEEDLANSQESSPEDPDGNVESDWIQTNDVHFVVCWERTRRGAKKETRSLTPPDLPAAKTRINRPPRGYMPFRCDSREDQDLELPLFPSLSRTKPVTPSADEAADQSDIADWTEEVSENPKEQQDLKPEGTPLLEFRLTVAPTIHVEYDDDDLIVPPPRLPIYPAQSREDYSLRKAQVLDQVLKVNSEHIVNALRAVTDYPVDIDLSKCPVEIPCDSLYLLHMFKPLQEFKVDQYDLHDHDLASEVEAHVDVLLDALEYMYGDWLAEAEKLENKGVATFKTLAALLKPGTEAYYHKNPNSPSLSPCVIHRVYLNSAYGRNQLDSINVQVWRVIWDHDKFTREMQHVQIFPFAGEMDIKKLRVYPASVHDQDVREPSWRSQAVLGRQCWGAASGVGLPYYELVPGYHIDDYPGTASSSFMSRRVLIDYYFKKEVEQREEVFGKRHYPPHPPSPYPDYNKPLPEGTNTTIPGCRCEQCCDEVEILPASIWSNLDDLDPRRAQAPLSNQYFHAMDKRMPCWLFATQTPRVISAENIRPLFLTPQREEVVFSSSDARESIGALISRFRKIAPTSTQSEASMNTQPVSRRRNGPHLILLHGPSGTGKSAAIEHMAETSRRPLFRLEPLLTRSDICRRYLESILDLCRRAGGVAFLDNAEKVLCSTDGRLGEASLSQSVILNCIDTFPGNILLATNDVARLDPVVMARVSKAIHFPTLTDEQRNKIWTNKFTTLEQDLGPDRVYVSPQARVYVQESSEVAELKWNGFEMQNALRNAIELAEDEMPPTNRPMRAVPSHAPPPFPMMPGMSPRKHSTIPPPPRNSNVIVLEKHFREVVGKAVELRSQVASYGSELHG